MRSRPLHLILPRACVAVLILATLVCQPASAWAARPDADDHDPDGHSAIVLSFSPDTSTVSAIVNSDLMNSTGSMHSGVVWSRA